MSNYQTVLFGVDIFCYSNLLGDHTDRGNDKRYIMSSKNKSYIIQHIYFTAGPT